MPAPSDKDELVIEGLRQNNLKNISVRIPHNVITTIVGLSGSGKSSLAFDTLFAEGRWRFIESLSTYTRLFLERMDRPDVDTIRNIRPAIAVEQKNPVRGSRSTVGTTTELNDYLRLLFSRVGRLHCPECGSPVYKSGPEPAAESILAGRPGEPVYIGFNINLNGKQPEEAAAELLGKGFIRVKAGADIIDISEGFTELPRSFGVVTDRLIVKESERQRLTEALETAFSAGNGAAWAYTPGKGEEAFSTELICRECGTRTERPTSISLSFNHPVGACPECKGFGNLLKYDEAKVLPDKTLSLREGAIEPWTKPAYRWWYEELEKHAHNYGIDLNKPFEKLSARERRLVFEGTSDFEGINDFFDYLESKKYKLHIKVFSSRYKGQVACPSCKGTRLKKQALSAKVGGLNIAEASALSIKEAREFFSTIELTSFEEAISEEVLKQIRAKLEFLSHTGLGYITLDRLTKTLSGGEAQRVTIATQLASSLCGVLYILDEPSIGLHPVDIDMLTSQLERLSSMGNTVVTVEHDPGMIRRSSHVIELGPGSGEKGGHVVWAGPTKEFLKGARTLTADYLAGREEIHVPRWRRKGSGRYIQIRGASGNNLKSADLSVPLKTMTCVTGVSGSGKSTLVVDTLYNVLASHFGEKSEPAMPYSSVHGLDNLSGVKLIDQSPIGRTPRSNPLTYIGGFDEIRKLFSGLSSARAMGLAPGDFSFNVPGGRCESCKGEGVEKLEMYFLPDVYVKCAVCGGKRYKGHVLDVKYRGRSIYDVLETTFEDAILLFPNEPGLQRRFSVLKSVGLGYLKLGQPATTLSGGEAQRLKIARELVEESSGDVLYILDEPTTGLHMDDVKKLLSVLGALVDSGSTVLMIEHNLDCIKSADHVIDLGPRGGGEGGAIVASGTPEEISRSPRSLTGKYLKKVLH
ncbi:MAG: excinuclease ABC subunit A [Deltaproteobacteria bacterium GWC2_55_46]|nr:MAG: excinuclease ABC subunit A [Deltaproteobacteria bacterium GWA2_55_82]OGQ65052.1 MAG: excinuclease ABC subunit A [Deltaproteobacteria bacterium RIFCSPLOWO2_02_FULL_55_12]OIJ75072.1 MAG: excinuclease ABC subunit A [Deltaproteobacteria bacterium GWC2_55_46]